MRIGRLEILISQRIAPALAEASNTTIYTGAVEEVARVLDGLDWMVVAGLAIPITCHEFYREHRDLDIGIARGDFARLVRAFQSAGYSVTARIGMFTTRKRKLEFFWHTRPESRLVRWRPRNLRVFCERGGRANYCAGCLMSHIDLYLYHETSNLLTILDGRVRIPKIRPIRRQAVLPSGRPVPVVDLYYVRAVKQHKRGEVHQLDCDRIRGALETAIR